MKNNIVMCNKKFWNRANPTEKGGYICRMDNAYIKMCYWDGNRWNDMWKTSLKGYVIEWMYIPYDGVEIKSPTDLNYIEKDYESSSHSLLNF